MGDRKLTDYQRKKYINTYTIHGEQGLYSAAIGAAIIKAAQNESADIELLDHADIFFALSRQKGEEDLFTIGKILRRAAHVVYRTLLKKNKNKKSNPRFLTAV